MSATYAGRWYTDPDKLRAAVREHGTISAAARATGSSTSTLNKWWHQHGFKPLPSGQPPKEGRPVVKERARKLAPGLEVKGDVATLVTEPTPYQLGDIDALLKERGLDPAEWLVERALVNEWDAYAGRDDDTDEPRVVKLRQLKVTLKRRVSHDWLFPASEVKRRHRPKERRATSSKAETLAVVVGDQQAPYHDEKLHQAFLRWLADVKPHLGALTGDTIDLPTVSRHPDRPHWNATPQTCIDAGYRLLSDYVDAAATTRWRKLRGNHDWRLESELLARAERMFGLKPAEIPGTEQVPGYSIRNLLHLDALGIELVGREGDKWELAELELADGITVRHRLPSAAKATRMGRTILAGDSHRQRLQRTTLWHGDEPTVLTLVEAGCMCSISGLGYTFAPDWQQGFATVTVETGHVDLATWDGAALTWRGRRW